MRRIIAPLILLGASFLVASQLALAITIPTVPVGNVGNGNDPQDGDTSLPGLQNFGAVGYAYAIGTQEVTVGQYTMFLNAVAATDTYALYSTSMALNFHGARILRSGISGSYSYTVDGSVNHPVTNVSWADAARFSNWLHNDQPIGGQNASTTESGAYPLNGATSAAALNAISRSAGAKWVIPTENEWYKAAYHQPAAQGGDADSYWTYPTRTNDTPYSDQPPGSDAPNQSNTANYRNDDGDANGYNDGYALTGSSSLDNFQIYLTDVGAYTESSSFYGTFDQAGNVFEWNETVLGNSGRGFRGGSFVDDPFFLLPSFRFFGDPTGEFMNLGFRVASVSEPSAGVLAACAFGIMWRRRKWHW